MSPVARRAGEIPVEVDQHGAREMPGEISGFCRDGTARPAHVEDGRSLGCVEESGQLDGL
jgi:hypothetical protein